MFGDTETVQNSPRKKIAKRLKTDELTEWPFNKPQSSYAVKYTQDANVRNIT